MERLSCLPRLHTTTLFWTLYLTTGAPPYHTPHEHAWTLRRLTGYSYHSTTWPALTWRPPARPLPPPSVMRWRWACRRRPYHCYNLHVMVPCQLALPVDGGIPTACCTAVNPLVLWRPWRCISPTLPDTFLRRCTVVRCSVPYTRFWHHAHHHYTTPTHLTAGHRPVTDPHATPRRW